MIPPLQTATTYLRDPDNQYRRGLSYGRADNATVGAAEALLCELEGGAAAAVRLRHGGRDGGVPGAGAGRSRGGAQVMYWGLRHWLTTSPGTGGSVDSSR